MSYFMDIITGYWGRVKEEDLQYLHTLRKLLLPRRKKLPDPKYIMVKINSKWDDIEVLEYLVNRTKGELYLTNSKIGFLNEQDAMMFTLRFG